ncbi:MAG: hypothetical protein M3Q82_07910 [Actinomycetota bacterium]|nr:hypothetical protein [Actinomycetota bacterium]
MLATKTAVQPTPQEIHDRLGAESSSHALDYATLNALYEEHSDNPTVVLKRGLWANLLRSALGTQLTDDDSLFLEHTLLVKSAEIIEHLVLGLKATELSPGGNRRDTAVCGPVCCTGSSNLALPTSQPPTVRLALDRRTVPMWALPSLLRHRRGLVTVPTSRS